MTFCTSLHMYCQISTGLCLKGCSIIYICDVPGPSTRSWKQSQKKVYSLVVPFNAYQPAKNIMSLPTVLLKTSDVFNQKTTLAGVLKYKPYGM